MRILEQAVYVGPSLYAHFPVIRLEVDLGPLEAWPSAKLGPAFIDRLIEALPGLHEHGCSYGEPGGFIRRLREEKEPHGRACGSCVVLELLERRSHCAALPLPEPREPSLKIFWRQGSALPRPGEKRWVNVDTNRHDATILAARVG